VTARGASTSPPTVREFSAGGLVARGFRGRPWIACIRVKGGEVLALPKGHIDPGESAAEAAAREVREETGIEATLVDKLEDVRYWYHRSGARVFKVVSFFLFRYRSGSVRDHDHEVDSAEWVPLADAPRLLSYRGERAVAETALRRLEESG
jgi:8-oxo-dGTP pyrophosphatase MutT (NUDIX family)